MDLTQAEAVADLIESTSARTAIAAKRSLAGEFSKKVGDISNKVTEVRAFVETILDFSDQDLDETKHPKTLLSMLEEAKDRFEKLIEQTRIGIRVRNGLVITIMGSLMLGNHHSSTKFVAAKEQSSAAKLEQPETLFLKT